MTAVTSLPQSRPLTRSDLDRMPEDGHRYELIDGTLVVTPAPTPRHQRAVARLYSLLSAACPVELEVLIAPLDVVLADDTVMQPDLLVARTADFSERDLPVAPLLAVEVLSPSTRLLDLNFKRARFEQAGTTSYWVVDPDSVTLTAWDLVDGTYVEVARVTGGQELVATKPFSVAVQPSRLVV